MASQDKKLPVTVEIKGVQFVNKGAELMLHAVLQQLTNISPNCEVVLRPNTHSPYAKRVSLGAYQKLTLTRSVLDLNGLTYYLPKGVRSWLKNKWGIITEADIDVLLDASGFAYGDQWSSTALRQLSMEVNRFSRNNKPYVFLPQALGPFTRDEDRKRLEKSLPNAALIVARERTSFDNIKSLGVPGSVVMQYPDFTNLVKGICPEYFDSTEPVFLIIPNSKMVSAKNAQVEWQAAYIELLSNAIKIARGQGLNAVILNHEGKADQHVCEALQSQFSDPPRLVCEDDPIAVKGIIGSSTLVLCSRFHGCVSALSQGVACIGTSWSYKYERLFEDYGRRDFLISAPIDELALKQLIEEGYASRAADNNDRITALKSASLAMWKKVVECAF